MNKFELGNYINNILKENRHHPKYKPKIRRNTKRKKPNVSTIFIKGNEQAVVNLDDIKQNQIMTYNLEDLVLMLPKKRYLEKFIKLMLDRINDDKDKKNLYSCFVSFTIISGDTFNITTNKIPVLNSEGKSNRKYNKKINNMLKEINEKLPRYGTVEDEIKCAKVRLFTTISTFKNLNNWNLSSNDEYIKFKDFTIYSCNKKENCIKQCVEYLGGKYNKKLKLINQIPQNKLYIYTPVLNDMRYVTEINNLITDYQEDFKNNDCTNIARIIKHRGHAAVISEIKVSNRPIKTQKQKRINVEEEDIEEVFMDIESFTDNKTKMQLPYLLCWNINNNMHKEMGKNCVNSFVKNIIKLDKDVIIYAWFGSGYDYQYILTELKDNTESGNDRYIIKNGMIHFAKFKINNRMIILKDPYLFLLTSLDKASKAFNVLNKGSFPHNIISKWDDLYTIPSEWPYYKKKIIESFNGQFNVKYQEYIYKTTENKKSIMQNAIEYCEIDVLAMKQVWLKFKKLLRENLGLIITRDVFTLSQLCMKLMESSLPKSVKLHVPDKLSYKFVKNSLYGGRVIAKNGIYKEDILYADVVSLYPSAMRLLKHGYGEPVKVNKINWDKHGIYLVNLKYKYNKEPDNYLQFIPRRVEGRLKWNWFKEHVGTYHTYDLMIAKEENYEIEIIEGYEYPNSDYIFNNFIDKLYSLKDEHSRCSCEEQPCPIRMISKIGLNGGGYGKFVQKPIDKEVYLVENNIVASICEEMTTNIEGKLIVGYKLINPPKFYNLNEKYDKMVIETETDPQYATQCGISILSGSRYRLYKLCRQFPNIEIIYSDTDSVFVKKSSVDQHEFNKKCGTNLGDLDNTLDNSKTGIIKEMIIGGPKMYAYCYDDQIKMYCKGVPKNMLSKKQFEHLIESKDNEIMYHFEVLRRKLINILTDNIAKRIKQT